MISAWSVYKALQHYAQISVSVEQQVLGSCRHSTELGKCNNLQGRVLLSFRR